MIYKTHTPLNQKKKYKGFFDFITGGGGSSAQATIENTVESINKNLLSIISNKQNDASVNCTTNQVAKILIGEKAVVNNCDLNIGQTAFIKKCNLQSGFSDNSSNDLSTLVNQAVEQTGTADSKAVSDFLSSKTESNSNVTNKQTIQNILSKEINSSVKNSCKLNSSIQQDGTIEIRGKYTCGPSGKIDISQYAELEALGSCISDVISSILTNDQTLLASATVANAKSTAEGKGLTSMISALGTALTSMLDSVGNTVKGVVSSFTTTTAVIMVAMVAAFIAIAYFLFYSDAGMALIQEGGKIADKSL